MSLRSRPAAVVSGATDQDSASPSLPAAFWGDRVFTGEVKTKTVFPALVLQMLHAQPDSGYGLMQRISALGGIFPVNPNTIYPLLRRLEERGTDAPLTIAKRLEVAKEELAALGEFRYVIVNDRLDDAIGALEEVYEGAGAAD